MSRGAMSASADVGRPVLFVTGHLSADRVGAFAALHEREGIELALFGGRIKHGPAGIGELAEGFEKRRPTRARAHARGHPDLKDGTPQSTDLKDRTRQSNGDMPPTRRVRELATGRLAASGRYRAVVVSTGGRVALGASWAGA
ncbi:MAG TPA: hypothetical protein VL972_04100, partial [Solirubrobacteraceae bacterium]|nr:hypothetical protein [Solirubrobacteraceae bacterium]